jgi:hypothetical protein
MRGLYLVAASWANGTHDTAGYAEPHDRKHAQHQSEAQRYSLQEIEHRAGHPHPSSMKLFMREAKLPWY